MSLVSFFTPHSDTTVQSGGRSVLLPSANLIDGRSNYETFERPLRITTRPWLWYGLWYEAPTDWTATGKTIDKAEKQTKCEEPF